MSKHNEAITDTSFVFTTRTIPRAWLLDAPEPGANSNFAIEERICRSGQKGQTSIPATVVGRTQGGSHRASNDRLAIEEVSSLEDLNEPSLEKHFWARNALYALKNVSNPLKSQQKDAPSERTKHGLSV